MAQIVFQTDQSGANQNVCSTAVASTVTFNFSLSANYDAYSANITMKKASGTVDPVKVTIYNQPNGGGTAVGSSTVLAANVTQSFAPIEFLFSSLSLTAGTSYSLVISSTTSCSGSSPYSFKSGNFQIVDKATSAVINTGYAIVSSMSSVATLGSSPKASLKISASPSSSATISAAAAKSRAMSSSLSVVSSLAGSPNASRKAAASLFSSSSLAAAAYRNNRAASVISAASTLGASSRATRASTASLSSSANVTASALKSKAMSMSSYVVSALGAVAKMARSAAASLHAGTVSAASASVDKESSSNIKSASILEAVARLDSEASSAIVSRTYLSASAEITRGIECRHESNCSMSASAEINRGGVASIESSVSMEASLSGAKSLFSVFANLEVSSQSDVQASLRHAVSAGFAECNSTLVAEVALVATALSNIKSSCSLSADAMVTGEGHGKKREGSGHYVLNSGAFTLRQWKRFVKASDNHVPNRREPESRRIDLRAPALLRLR